MLTRRSLPFSILLAICVSAFVPVHECAAQDQPPLTLEAAISLAQAHHPSLQEAQAGVDERRAALHEVRAQRLPSLVVGEDALYSNDPVFAFGSKLRQARFSSSDFGVDVLNHPGAVSNFSASATGTWTAYDPAERHKIAGAEAEFRAADLQKRYTSEELTAKVVSLYYRVLTAENELTVANHAARRANEVDISVSDRVRSGLSLESDGARARIGAQSAQDDAAQARDNVTLARADLFAAIGLPPSDWSLERTADESVSIATPPVAGDIANRLDIQALEQQMVSARHAQAAAHAAALPQVTSFGHVENNAQYVAANGSGNWTVGAKIQMSVFDGGARKAREAQAAAQVRELEAKRAETILAASSTVAALHAQIDNLQRRLSTATASVQAQEDVLQTARDRYSSGLMTLTDVLNAESDLANAEFAEVRTRYQLRIAAANLALASGTPLTGKAGHP